MRNERFNQTEYLPLFGAEDGGQTRSADDIARRARRLEWARGLLLNSGLDVFTVDVLRTMIAGFKPDLIGDGLWLGSVFQCPLFIKTNAVNATRPDAKGRTIWQYTLTTAGVAARRHLKESHV